MRPLVITTWSEGRHWNILQTWTLPLATGLELQVTYGSSRAMLRRRVRSEEHEQQGTAGERSARRAEEAHREAGSSRR